MTERGVMMQNQRNTNRTTFTFPIKKPMLDKETCRSMEERVLVKNPQIILISIPGSYMEHRSLKQHFANILDFTIDYAETEVQLDDAMDQKQLMLFLTVLNSKPKKFKLKEIIFPASLRLSELKSAVTLLAEGGHVTKIVLPKLDSSELVQAVQDAVTCYTQAQKKPLLDIFLRRPVDSKIYEKCRSIMCQLPPPSILHVYYQWQSLEGSSFHPSHLKKNSEAKSRDQGYSSSSSSSSSSYRSRSPRREDADEHRHHRSRSGSPDKRRKDERSLSSNAKERDKLLQTRLAQEAKVLMSRVSAKTEKAAGNPNLPCLDLTAGAAAYQPTAGLSLPSTAPLGIGSSADVNTPLPPLPLSGPLAAGPLPFSAPDPLLVAQPPHLPPSPWIFIPLEILHRLEMDSLAARHRAEALTAGIPNPHQYFPLPGFFPPPPPPPAKEQQPLPLPGVSASSQALPQNQGS